MRGYVELWALSIVLAGAAVAIVRSMRCEVADPLRRVKTLWVVVLACFIALTFGAALALFRTCYESAAASLGMIVPNASKHLDAMICLTPHALEMIFGWILIVVSCIAAIGLIVLGIVKFKGALRRALAFTGAAFAFLFAIANAGLVVFSISWCQSSRLF